MEKLILDPDIPYVGPISGKCTPGNLVRIQGTVPGIAYRFDINLQCGPQTLPRDDIAIQISVRILDGFIIFNSLQNGIWDEEQRGATMPIRRAERFEVIVMCDLNKFKIAVNGQHFFEFPLRIPYDCVSYLSIDGDVNIIQISYESTFGGPSNSSVLKSTHKQIAPSLNGDDDFEVIDSNKFGFSQPPPYLSTLRCGFQEASYPFNISPSKNPYSLNGSGTGPNILPYPASDPSGMPIVTTNPTSTPGVTGTTSIPILEASPQGSSVLIPLNAPGSNFRPVKQSNMKKCCGYFWSTIIGIIIIIVIVISKVTRSASNHHNYKDDSYYSDNYNNYGSNNYDGYGSH